MPTEGGSATQITRDGVVDGLSCSNNFIVGDRGIYFVAAGDTPSATSIDFFEFGTGGRTTLAPIGKRRWSGIALSPD